MKKIVVPYDFSVEADFALHAASQLCLKQNAELHIMHVIEIPSGYLSLYPNYGFELESVYNDNIIKIVTEKLNKVAEKWAGKGFEVTSEVKYGKPFDSIQETIATEEADLIVMGSKGATGIKEMFVGSNTERVIRFAKVPVLTIKQEVNFNEITELLFATDFTADKSLEFAKKIQKMFDLRIRLLKVYNTNDWALIERTALEKLEEFGIEQGLKNYSYHAIDSPFVTDGILEFSHLHKVGLIVMGTHGYTGIGHLIAGSNAEGVANHSKIPIFTVHK
jgi:nucleotide-binding universal stress UspA family protein